MPFILGANSLTGGYTVDNSLRFNSASSDYLSKTFASSSNRKTWTVSLWSKRSNLSTIQLFMGTSLTNSDTNTMEFGWFSDNLSVVRYNFYQFSTTQLFRDVSAWYHIVLAFDTTQATDSNRMKLYVNGSQVTSFSTVSYPTLNEDLPLISSGQLTNIGRQYYAGISSADRYLNGYLSEINFIDGQALTPTDFGEFDEDSGIWKPIAYAGTYGTNGFYLETKDSGALGADTSGNANNFTVNNLTAVDQSTDTPTNNFCTWNAIIKSDVVLSEGNLQMAGGAISYDGTVGTIVPTQGKWYAEIKVTVPTYGQIGFITIDSFIDGARALYSSSSNIFWQDNETVIKYWLNSVDQGNATVTGGSNSVSTYTTNDIIMLAMDLDNGLGWFGKNGTWQNSGSPSAGTNAFNLASDYANGTTIFAGCDSFTVQANFGSPPYTISSGNADANGYGNFEYSVPTGYYSLCTKNLSEFG